LRELVRQARQYNFDMLAWKNQFVRRGALAGTQQQHVPARSVEIQFAYLRRLQRRAFFCGICQRRY
jgi:endonuclease-8